MIKVLKRMSGLSVILALIFMFGQVICDLLLPTLTSNMINEGVAKQNSETIWQIGFLMIGIAVLGILSSLGNRFFATREGQGVGKVLRTELYRKVLYFTNDEYDEFGTASLITRTTNDVNQVQMVTQMILRMMINAPITLVGAAILAYRKEHELTKVFLYVIPIMLVLMLVIMFFAVPLFKSMQKKVDKLNMIFREGLTGVRVIRAFNQADYEVNRFDLSNKEYTKTAIKVNTIISLMMPLFTLILSATNVAIIWFGGHYVADQTMAIGNLLAFTTYAMQILMSFIMLSMMLVLIPRAQASADRIYQVLETKPAFTDPKQPENMPLHLAQAELKFNHVNFAYIGSSHLTLEDIHFEVKEGQTLAIIGGTGSGKSSLVNLIPRFYDVDSGNIEVNQCNIQNVTQYDLREQIGFVPQKALLFKGSIRENMQYGNPDLSDEKIWQTLEIAQAADFVKKMENGLDSLVEQGGGNFSGGQKQRLAIARALCKPAALYVFDDSFSALDFKTDAALRKALKLNITKAIKVIVAQRISTVVDADLIVVLDNGKMVGKGRHQELIETCQTYQEIVNSQMGGENK